MSETQSTSYLKRACDIFIAGALLLLVFVLAFRTPLPQTKAIIESSAGNQTHIVTLGDKLDADLQKNGGK